jgi:hypothetical protein
MWRKRSPLARRCEVNTYQAWSASALGINPGSATPGAAGAGVPTTNAGTSGTDKGLLPWHPDSSTFWLALIAGATVLGIFGAEVGGRIGKGTAKVQVGKV